MFRRKCFCMNNSYQNNSCELENDMIEKQCNDVVSYENYTDGCACGFDEEYNVFPENPMLAQSYVPCQSMEEDKYIRETNRIGKGCNKCQ